MAQKDFQALRYQFMGHWQAIEQAEPAERRVLLVELAKALAEWEAEQVEPLDKIQDLKRTGHWSALAQVAGAQAQVIADRLGAEKQALRQRLEQGCQLITQHQQQCQTLQEEVESLGQELSPEGTTLEELMQREASLRQQLAALQRLHDLQPEVDRAKAQSAALIERMRQGDEPGDILAALCPLHELLATHYDAYLVASRAISDQLLNTAADPLRAPPAPEALAIPGRLLALDQELKAIDQVLAGQLRQQDEHDQAAMARA